ncbi:hypothetical protein [Clostridium sp.]|uniref:hypothetical protein n=1 Tax=Clostridium sp. TaxID=1506 RepID=UPI003D6D8C62
MVTARNTHLPESTSKKTEENGISIENKLIKKDQLINQLNYIIKEEKNKVMILNNKICVLENNYIQWESQKSRLFSDTNLLQEALILKESQIHKLEKAMLEEEIKLIELRKINLNSEEENKKNSQMEPEIKGYKISIINSNKTIEDLNSKISHLKEEKVELIDDKNNSSLFKKLFN